MRYKELLHSCLAGDMLHLSPAAAWQHKPVLDQTSSDFAYATAAEQKLYDYDFVKLTPASTWQSIDNGLQDRWNNDFLGRREVVRRNITQFEHWVELPRHGGWQGFSGEILQAIRLTKAQLPEHVPLLITVFNPFFQAVQQSGLAFLLQSYHEAPEYLSAGLNTLLVNTLTLIEQCMEAGADGVFFVSQHASADALSTELYQKLALPADLSCIKAIEALPCSMLHLHGKDVYSAMFEGLNIPLHCDDVADSQLGGQISRFSRLAGLLPPNELFCYGSQEDVTKAVMQKRRLLADRCYVVSPGCALPLHVPADNIHAMMSAARNVI